MENNTTQKNTPEICYKEYNDLKKKKEKKKDKLKKNQEQYPCTCTDQKKWTTVNTVQ